MPYAVVCSSVILFMGVSVVCMVHAMQGAGNGDVAATCVVGGSSSSRSQASRARTLAATGLPETKPAAIAADSSSGSSKVQHVGFGPVFGCLDEALMAALVVNHPHLQFLELHRAVQYSKGALKPLQRLRSFHSLRVPVRDNVALLDIAERKQLQQLSLAVTRDVSMPGMAPLITIGPQLRAVTVAPACHERTYLKCGTKQVSCFFRGLSQRESLTAAVSLPGCIEDYAAAPIRTPGQTKLSTRRRKHAQHSNVV